MRLIREGGAGYYGIYWHVVEMLHYTPDALLDDVVDAVQMVLRVENTNALSAVKFMLSLGLFSVNESNEVKCERVQRNIQARTDLARKKSYAASKRWESVSIPTNGSCNSDAMQVHSTCLPGAMLRQDKTEQDKTGKEKKEKSARVARPCSSDEVKSYFAELGLPSNEAERFQDYYAANGWRVGKNPMKDWRAAARNWRKGFQDKQMQSGNTSARTQPTGLPAHVVEIANRPKLSQSDVEGFKQAYLSKVSPGE